MSLFKRLTGKELLKEPIAELVRQGNAGVVFEKLVEGGPSLLAESNELRQTLLHIAVEQGHIEVVRLLLLHRLTNIDAQDVKGQTPLHLAAYHRRLEVCKYLLEKGADVTLVNADRVPVIHFLVRCAFSSELKEILQLVLARGTDKDVKDNYGESPLQRAAASLNLEAVAWLLQQGADVNSSNRHEPLLIASSAWVTPRRFGETALHKATRMLHADEDKAVKLIELLLSKGADPTVEGSHGAPLAVLSKKSPSALALLTKKDNGAAKETSGGRRLVMRLPPDWALLDSKQKSEFLLAEWGNQSQPVGDARKGGEEGEDGSAPDHRSLSGAKIFLDDTLSSSQGAPSPVPPAGDRPICASAAGYRVELGNPQAGLPSPTLDIPPEHYKKRYMPNKHYNYLGYLNVHGDEREEPAAISILVRPPEASGSSSACTALVRTQLGSVELPVHVSYANPTAAELLAALTADKSKFPDNHSFTEVDNPELMFELLEYDKNDPQRCTSLPIGVIYVPRAPMDHLDIWAASNQSSAAFEQFLQLLGDRITLQGWSGYAGGLDTLNDMKGRYSVYTRWRGLEIMFHVSTLLPYNDRDHAKVQISRVIGNDITNIVFVDGEGAYDPATFLSAVTHVYGVVHPKPEADGTLRYAVAIASKYFVPLFGPQLPPDIPQEHFKDWFLAKMVNGHFASQRSKGLFKMYSRPRECLLRALVEQFAPAAAAEKKAESKHDKKHHKEKGSRPPAADKSRRRSVLLELAGGALRASQQHKADAVQLHASVSDDAALRMGPPPPPPAELHERKETPPPKMLGVSTKVDNLKGLMQAENATLQAGWFGSRLRKMPSDTDVAQSHATPPTK